MVTAPQNLTSVQPWNPMVERETDSPELSSDLPMYVVPGVCPLLTQRLHGTHAQ